jgi:hypothetical protein
MHGIILLKSNYTYEGSIISGDPHGKGIFTYANGDKYTGECKFGKPDGFGNYIYKSGATYNGFFSYGRLHGVGTFEDKKNIYKGSWRCDRKHGIFYRTNKINFSTYLQRWIKGKLNIGNYIQYIQPNALKTTKINPIKKPKKYQISYKGIDRKCIGCYNKPTNSTNDACGHVTMCFECLSKCDRCPICRAPIGNIIKLYIC